MILHEDRRLGGTPRLLMVDEDDPIMEVPPEVKDCVVFLLGASKKHGGTRRVAGTAFFVQVSTAEDAEGTAIYLVTARHVVDDIKEKSIDGIVWVRINNPDEGCSEVGIEAKKWVSHPTDNSVDVAAVLWQSNAFMIRTVPKSMAVTELVMKKENFSLGDEVFITGLFKMHYGTTKNVPIVRVGNVAMIDKEPIQTKRGPMEGYLIEARSIGGLSGSPVFIHVPPMRFGIANALSVTGLDAGKPPFFWFGLIHGHWDAQDSLPDTLVEDAIGDTINMGIAVVVPATKVLEVLDQEQFVKQRKEKAKRAREKNLPTQDSALDADTSSEPHRPKPDANESAKSMIDEIARKTEGRKPKTP